MENSRLCISKNNKYFMKDDNPFFWLGDTAWLMLQKLSLDEIKLYLRNRKELGYNVIQTVLIHDSYGDKKDLVTGSAYEDGLKYWNHVDKVITMAEEMGIYIGLLPTWGSIVKNGTLNLNNVEAYSEFLGKRYHNCKNIIWMLGGDIRGAEYAQLYRIQAEILKKYNPMRLMTYHTFGRTSSSMWFHEEPWLDFNTFQSGHRRYDQQQLGEWDDAVGKEIFHGEDVWKYVQTDHSYDIVKPTLDAEPSYEGIPQGLHNTRNPYWEEWDVRRYAYWSVLAGAAGHTYGNNAVMQFYDGVGKSSYGCRETWQDAIHHSGAAQLQHLKNLMLSVDYTKGQPADQLLSYGQKERYHRIAVFASEEYILCYDYNGDQFMLDLSAYMDTPMDSYWMDPRSGTYSYAGEVCGIEKLLVSPVARKEKSNDWVYILKKQGI